MAKCETEKELEFGEQAARRMLRASKDDHLQMLYAQWALEAKRMQSVHYDSCLDCQQGEAVTGIPAREGNA